MPFWMTLFCLRTRFSMLADGDRLQPAMWCRLQQIFCSRIS